MSKTKHTPGLEMLEALKQAAQFIRNGIEFGYIRMPEYPQDPAHHTLPLIDAAIAQAEGKTIKRPIPPEKLSRIKARGGRGAKGKAGVAMPGQGFDRVRKHG